MSDQSLVYSFWILLALGPIAVTLGCWGLWKIFFAASKKPDQIATPAEEMPRFATVLDCSGQLVVIHFPPGTTRPQIEDAEEMFRKKKTELTCPRCGGKHKPIVVEVKKKVKDEVQS
jgi:hypothetical protein